MAQGKAAALGRAGAKPSAPYNLAEWRSLRKGAGAECQPEHLGARLEISPSSAAYSPLESALPSDPPSQTAPAVAVDGMANDGAVATVLVAARRVWQRGDDGVETMAAAAVFFKAVEDAKVQSPPP